MISNRAILRGPLVLALMGCGGAPRLPPPVPITSQTSPVFDSQDEALVYGKALETLFAHTEERPGVIVVFDSLEFGLSYDCGARSCLSPEVDTWVNKSTLVAYASALRSRGTFPRGVVGPAPVIILTRQQRDSLEEEERAAARVPQNTNQIFEPFWDAFRKSFPRAWGLTVFSRIGFNPSRDQALVQVRHGCGGNCHRMESMFFLKRNGVWVFESRFPEAVQDWVGQGELRYPGPDARALTEYRKRQDSTRQAIADSLARDRAPRRIRGTVTTRKTGRPIPFAQIFVRSAPTYPNPWTRMVADSTGRYEVRNPPLGGTMLEAQCPGAGPRDGATLDAPGVYVFPALDTTINLVAPDIAPCWRARRIHKLHSGWFASKEAAAATSPNAEERAVYSAVIETLQARTGRTKAVATYSHTIAQCQYSERCGSVQLPRLERAGLVDSPMIREFDAKTATPSPLHPTLVRLLGLSVITPQEIVYYTEESLPFGYRRMDASQDTTLLWKVFRSMNGSMNGIVRLSAIAFDSRHTRALVEARLDTAMSYGRTTNMMLLQKVGGAWRVAIKDVGKGITSGEWSGDRCVPVEAPKSLNSARSGDLSGDFIITMVGTVGRTGTSSVRMRLTKPMRGDTVTRNEPPATKLRRSTPSTVFEIIDEVTGQPDELGSLDFWLDGKGLGIRRKSRLMRLDGYSRFLVIRRVTESGFFGSWSGGVFVVDEFGHFCARRVTTARAPH